MFSHDSDLSVVYNANRANYIKKIIYRKKKKKRKMEKKNFAQEKEKKC